MNIVKNAIKIGCNNPVKKITHIFSVLTAIGAIKNAKAKAIGAHFQIKGKMNISGSCFKTLTSEIFST